MESYSEGFCSLLVGLTDLSPNPKELKDALERGGMSERAAALETLIRLHVNGEPQNHMIMTVIKYITPLDDHWIKKLVLYFWEVVDKTDSNGKLLSEMILICSFLREDLQHPNEYIRGLALRFLCKVKEVELVEPLISSIVQNLTHRITYVRRNAALAVHRIYKRFPELLPDAPELMEKFVCEENDVSACRNGFDMLVECAPERAVRFLTKLRSSKYMESVGPALQMSIVDFARHMIRSNPCDKGKYVTILFSILQSSNPAVRYQCASTLLSLSSSPTAIRQAALTFIDLLKTHTDSSVRLIVVDQLDAMRGRFSNILQDSLLDIMSALGNGTTEIRKRIIALAVELVSSKNNEVFLHAVKKELARSMNEGDVADQESLAEYRKLLTTAVRTAVRRQPHMAAAVLPLMMGYICDLSSGSEGVICFVREVLQVQPSLRAETLKQLSTSLPLIHSPVVVRTALWLFGTHASSPEEVLQVLALLGQCMKPLPLVAPAKPAVASGANSMDKKQMPATQAVTKVREDGTYVTSYVPVSTSTAEGSGADALEDSSGLRSLIINGNYFVAAALARTLAKLIIRLHNQQSSTINEDIRRNAQNEALTLLDGIISYGTSANALCLLDHDSHEQIQLARLNVTNPQSPILAAFVEESSMALSVAEKDTSGSFTASAKEDGSGFGEGDGSGKGKQVALHSVDAPLMFTQLMEEKESLLELEVVDDLGCAIANESIDKTEEFLKKLERTVPLSGFCDEIYCEAYTTVHRFDVSIDWYLANCTSHTLRDVTIELAPLGNMKLCERPQVFTLQPHGSIRLRTSLKVSSTEAGIIYASVVYDGPNNERSCVVLNDIRIDIMDYIIPTACSTEEFREKWGKFSWETTLAVNTDKTDLREYVEFVMRETNMCLLEPYPEVDEDELLGLSPTEEEDDYSYVSCSMYARTVFGEDALANVSIERDAHGKIGGVVRIRSNVQSIAYGIGERLSALERGVKL
uniref:Coatomer subunit beta n=1 Tax=Trypanosoma congolense (strain IL3000) TaxID=1068625 RepID=G0UJ15_TRYCI|nr:putative coatomer beta subunit [Trypanosoma congolense IL3000]